jgi:hypothetical protein
MSSLIASMDKNKTKRFNTKGHTELGWGNTDLDEMIVQFFFQLVRKKETVQLECILDSMLYRIKGNEYEYMKQFTLLYKLIGQTRDIVAGKGEQELSLMLVFIWWRHYPELAKYAFRQMVVLNDDAKLHPYGSWKDIKYMCRYVEKKTKTKDHPLIEYALELAEETLKKEIDIIEKYKKYSTLAETNNLTMPEKPNLSLISRWLPREKSAFGWVFKRLALKMYPQFLETAVSTESKKKAKIKSYIKLKQQLTYLNALIDTPQIKMCDKKGRWNELNFNNVTTQTLRRNRRAIMNLKKNNMEKHDNKDRKECAKNFLMHKEAAKADPERHKIHGKRANVYEYVKDAFEIERSENFIGSVEMDASQRKAIDDQIDSVNLQWESNKTNNKGLEKTPIISMVDTSGSMESNNKIPLYNAIGLGIRTSELTHPAFKDRVLTFSVIPQWINMSNIKDNFVRKCLLVGNSNLWKMNTNFYKALKLILDTIIENEIPPQQVEGMVLAVYSDMQIDPSWSNYSKGNKSQSMNTMFEEIEEMYKEAGMRSIFRQPYKSPHLLFWNLASTDGFPSKTTQKNVTFMSGYNSVLLNNFCKKGMEALVKYTPESMLCNLLDNPRYRCLEVRAMADYS